MTYPHTDPELEQYDEAFADAPEPDDKPAGCPVPPGKYQVEIVRALVEAGYDGLPQLSLHCKIIGPNQIGRYVFPSASFNAEPCVQTKEGMRAPIEFLKALVARLGMDPPITRASEIPGRLAEMIGRVLEVKVVANPKAPDYPKVYVQRYVSGPETPMVTEDELPF